MILGKNQVLQSISGQFKKGEVTTIIGPNGAGKSTLLKCLAGLYRSEGEIWIDEQKLVDLSLKERAKLISYVPQASEQLFPLTVIETVLLGRRPFIKWGISPKDIQIVHDTLCELEIDGLAQRYLDEISGGQRQKVAIARALVQQAPILMLDEPISALDIRYQYEVLELARKLAVEKNQLVIMVLHDLELAARFSDTILLLHNGKIASTGSPKEIITTENLQEVYGVVARIDETDHGLKVTVEQPIKKRR